MNSRKDSSIYNMRLFHNWIKKQLINECATYLRDTYNIKNITLLDLAVGKGGDMNKWKDNKIIDVIGFDIDSDSIYGNNGARNRYEQLKKKYKYLNYNFYVVDLSKKDNAKTIDDLIKGHKMQTFNIISCQFAIHYFFKDVETLNTLISIVDNYIDKNGFFIATCIDGRKIKKIMTQSTYTSNLFSIKKHNDEYEISLGAKEDTGHYFSDKPSVEYLVDIDILKNICDKHDIMFIGNKEFKLWYNEYSKYGQNLLSDDELEFSFLNFSLVFMRKR